MRCRLDARPVLVFYRPDCALQHEQARGNMPVTKAQWRLRDEAGQWLGAGAPSCKRVGTAPGSVSGQV